MFQQLSNIMVHSSEKQKHKRKVRALPDLISKLLLHVIHQISLVSLMVPHPKSKTFLKSLTFWALSQKVCWAIHNKPIEVDYFDNKEVEVVVKIDFWKLFKNHSLLKFLGLSNKFNPNFVNSLLVPSQAHQNGSWMPVSRETNFFDSWRLSYSFWSIIQLNWSFLVNHSKVQSGYSWWPRFILYLASFDTKGNQFDKIHHWSNS